MTQQSHSQALYLEEIEIERDSCIPLFIAALFTIPRTWKQPRCPSTDEWIKKLWYIYTVEYYSAIKRNTLESVLMRQMNLEPFIQSEVSQKEKDKHCILTHISGIQRNGQRRQWHPTPLLLPGKSCGQRSLVGCSPWGRQESDTTERLHFDFSLSCIGEGNGNPVFLPGESQGWGSLMDC